MNKTEDKYITEPVKQAVIETEKAVFVDGQRINYVLTDSVKTEDFGNDVIVTLSFVASSFTRE